MLENIYQSIIEGETASVIEGIQQALATGHKPDEILSLGMIPAMEEVGRLFEAQEFYVPEMLIAARAMKEGISILRPHLVQAKIKPLGKVILGTVRGDLHDIGKNLVRMMLEGNGFEVNDLGVDVPSESFIRSVVENRAEIVALSALLTTTLPAMHQVIEAIKKAGLRDKVKVIVGGAPVTEQFANEIGADYYGADAVAAAKKAKLAIGVA